MVRAARRSASQGLAVWGTFEMVSRTSASSVWRVSRQKLLPNRSPEMVFRQNESETFVEVTPYRGGAVYVSYHSGSSEWERHPNGDEVVMVLEGTTTAVLLLHGREARFFLGAHEPVVVPMGVWLRFEAFDKLKAMTITPQPTEHRLETQGIQNAQLQDVVDHLHAFIEAYDSSVRSGASSANEVAADMVPVYIPRHSGATYVTSGALSSGFADYLVGFGPEGTVKEVLLLDATPDIRLGNKLRNILMGYRVGSAPSPDSAPLRYAFIPVIFDDGQYRLVP
ncbi:hypothetical protein [Dyella sp. ASV21]|uniref:hypothetical protein n=1 Tax=Dyella sp. ASV21 TaxID=2795114 RepID=UPI0018ECC31C|nr:hypothetical protein [Dyella sp. ASV21]